MEAASEHRRKTRERPAEERCMCMLLHAPGCTGEASEPVKGWEWLRMQMYVLSRDMPELGLCSGHRGLDGFGTALDAARRRCAESGLVAGGRDGEEIRLTRRGRADAEALWREADGDTREAVADAKEFLNDMSYWEIVSFVYSEYPEAAEGPEIAGMFERERLGAAASLAMRRKVSVSKAAEIAGIGTVAFEAELEKRGMRPYSLDWKRHQESLRLIERITDASFARHLGHAGALALVQAFRARLGWEFTVPEEVLAGLAQMRVPPEIEAFLADGTARVGRCSGPRGPRVRKTFKKRG